MQTLNSIIHDPKWIDAITAAMADDYDALAKLTGEVDYESVVEPAYPQLFIYKADHTEGCWIIEKDTGKPSRPDATEWVARNGHIAQFVPDYFGVQQAE